MRVVKVVLLLPRLANLFNLQNSIDTMAQTKLSEYEKPWRSEQILFQKYVLDGKPIKEIATEFGCSHSTVSNWMDRYDIEARWPYGRDKVDYAKLITLVSREHSYEVWNDNDASCQVRVHRLVAVAEYGFDEVKNKEIHHKNGIEWDNRPENLVPLTTTEHAKTHHKNGSRVTAQE